MVSVCADPGSVSSSCLILAFTFLSLASVHLRILGGNQRVCSLNINCPGLCAPSTENRKEAKSCHCFSGIHKVWMVDSATGTNGNKSNQRGNRMVLPVREYL